MIRLFNTHKIRKQTELTGLWNFHTQNNDVIKVAVPSCWETYPGYANYQGKGVYETTFTGKGNLRVVCKGVSHTADVFVDDKKVAHHYNAYTAFDAIIRGASEQTHTLKIEADNSFSEASALHIPNDYMSYGGIARPVFIEEVPDVFIEWVHAVPVLENNIWSLNMQAKICNVSDKPHKASLKTVLNNQETIFNTIQVLAGESVIVSTSQAYVKVLTYTIESPTLYLLECTLTIDDASTPQDDLIERIGFREVTVKGADILLNGRKILFKGFCRHEDHPQFGCALPLAAMEYDVNQIRDLGANAIRTVHYPNDELFLDLCDEKGILVWEENHARGLEEDRMRNPNFKEQCKNCIDEMINQHYNHPSIVIWGILNECASESEYGKECYAEQFAQIKSLDISRPTSFASCKFFKDICLGLVDIVSYNIYPEWYHNADVPAYMDELYQWVQTTQGMGKPYIISEIGAGGIFGNRGGNCTKWSEERQADLLEIQVKSVLEKEYGSGIFVWQYCDVRVSEEWFDKRPRTMNNKGVVDEYRRRKLSYQVVKNIMKSYPNYR